MSNQELVLASYFNYVPDPQRGYTWGDEPPKRLFKLINSVISKGASIKIFHNCFNETENNDTLEWIKITPDTNYVPSVTRWFEYYKYLKEIEEMPESVFMVDSTDVKMLKNPFPHLQENFLYCGDEEKTVETTYLSSKIPFIQLDDYSNIIQNNISHKLLNAGICGGKIDIVLEFLDKLTSCHKLTSNNLTDISLDMPVYNYVLLKYFKDSVKYGLQVNTPFKQNTHNEISWWKHK